MSIIVEGMDGSGKSSLVSRLSTDLGIPIHERASASLTGPVANVYDWAIRDNDSWHTQPFSIYDRHPLISELIYGPVVRQHVDPRFYSAECRAMMQRFWARHLVILCNPPIETLGRTFANSIDHQWELVTPHFMKLARLYQVLSVQYPGSMVEWDYTQPAMYETLLKVCRNFTLRNSKGGIHV